ncbi:hypothetical protein CRYUN_Cryun05aG0229700 [Craigia yunnanensis]
MNYSLTLLHKPLFIVPLTGKKLPKRNSFLFPCHCTLSSSDDTSKPAFFSLQHEGRRALVGSLLTVAAAMYACDVAEPLRQLAQVKELFYDLKVGSGLKAVKGAWVAVRL